MSPRKHVDGTPEQIDEAKDIGISQSLANEYNFCLNRDDDDHDFDIYQSISDAKLYSETDDYYGMVGFDEAGHLYDLYHTHPNEGTDEYDPYSEQILEELKHAREESGGHTDEYESSMYEIQNTCVENLDFENNALLWLPPNAYEEEDVKGSVFYVEDEECSGDWGSSGSPSSTSSKEFHYRERSNQDQHSVMKDVVSDHLKTLILQLLKVENLPIDEVNTKESWLEIVTSLSWEVATLLKPDTSKDGGMDPTAYVKVKCLARGNRSDSMVVKGVVCKKNVAHRRMMSKIDKPQLLILGGALEYQRVSHHLSSVDTLLRQETEHLKMVVAKIDSYHPNLLLVEKSVSRYAQEYLLAKNISLVLNIKRELLEHIAQCSGTQIIPSVDHLGSPKLGNCGYFYVEKCFEEHGSARQGGKKITKNLMFFRDCPKPLGFTVLLKGAHGDELKKVKHVVHYGIFAAYHLALETSFLADEGTSFPLKPHQPGKPSLIKTTMLHTAYVPSTEAPQSNTTSTSDQCSTVTSPSKSESSPSSIKSLDSPIHHTHSSNIDQSVIALLSSIQKFSSSDHSDQFLNYEFENVYEREISSTPGSKDGDVLLDGSAVSNFIYDANSLEEPVYYACSHDSSLNNNNLSVSQSISCEDNESVYSEGSQILRDGVLTSHSEQQSILVSLTTRCVWKGVQCEKAHFLRIKYYASFDKPLGRFLRHDLFDQNYHCRSCEQPSEAHIHCYTHQQGSLTISVTKLVELILPGENEGKIWMWHRCLRCPRTNGFPPSTHRVPMSDAAWGFSFGKFLDLTFSNHAVVNRASSCGHSIHRDCLRFYGCGRMVACFRYTPINVYSVFLPPIRIEFSCEKQEWVKKEANQVKNKVNLFFNEVNKTLTQILEDVHVGSRDSSTKVELLKSHCEELERTLTREKEEFEDLLKRALNREERVEEPGIDVLELNRLRRQLLFQSYIWDQRLLHVVDLHKNVLKEEISSKLVDKSLTTSTSVKLNNGNSSSLDGKHGHKSNEEGTVSPVKKVSIDHAICDEVLLQTMHTSSMDVLESGSAIQRSISAGQSPLAMDIPESPNFGKLSASYFDHDKFSKKSELEKPNSPRTPLLSRGSENAEHSTSWLAMPFLNFYRAINKSPSWNRHKFDSVKGYNPVYIMSFKELECQDGARLLLPVGVNDTIVAVHDDEPSSIITYSLLSHDYHSQMSTGIEFAHSLRHLDLEISLDSSNEAPPEPLRSFVSADESIMSLSRLRNNLALDPLFYAKPLHTKVTFSDDGPPGKVKFTVVSYFARRFEAIRKMCCHSVLDFARSLSRCKKWGAQGGKSNVFFAKTPDDRFILKQVTKTELESFMKFAPAYFKYLSESINTKSPTCLAKILGVYQITKQIKGKETKMDILVMENILYRRDVSVLYDLKGSSRSRYNSDSSGGNKVLLDQNLLEAMSTSPIFVGNNSKCLLERAIWNDTSFLASVDVMDYSLLVGIDQGNQELVVGTIDFMRQYTWDKHLETWVKASGILGGPKNASPTVISPMQYKKRFRKAMTTYFSMVPDCWTSNQTSPKESIFDISKD